MNKNTKEILHKSYKRKKFWRKAAAILYPERCPYCDTVIEPGKIACDNCLQLLHSEPFEGYAFGGYKCISAAPYIEPFSKAVKDFKFKNNTQISHQLAQVLAVAVKKAYPELDFDMITCVPLHENKLKARGYNQSELLAQDLSLILKIPYENTLKKTKDNEPQHSLSGTERQKNVLHAYKPLSSRLVKHKNILIIDDVITTGHTLGECCKMLRVAGCNSICCATFTTAVVKTT
ncbi:MAG: phosphoribosyltransferase family protein [Eubacteriales bacterium]|nr:phosphoribosyltransferase family protein [Eubacteriales bacterium]